MYLNQWGPFIDNRLYNSETEHKHKIKDVRVKRGAECGTDHRLLVLQIWVSMAKRVIKIKKVKLINKWIDNSIKKVRSKIEWIFI